MIHGSDPRADVSGSLRESGVVSKEEKEAIPKEEER
jgi:hypothetical protein